MFKVGVFSVLNAPPSRFQWEPFLSLQTILLLGLLAVAYGQVLRISPAVIGSSGAGQVQVIQLGQGGSVSPFRAQSNRLVAQPIRFQQARPVQVVAQPQLIRLVQVRPQPQPIRIVQAQPQIVRVAQAAPISRQSEDESPKPFSFAFDSEDEVKIFDIKYLKQCFNKILFYTVRNQAWTSRVGRCFRNCHWPVYPF